MEMYGQALWVQMKSSSTLEGLLDSSVRFVRLIMRNDPLDQPNTVFQVNPQIVSSQHRVRECSVPATCSGSVEGNTETEKDFPYHEMCELFLLWTLSSLLYVLAASRASAARQYGE
eukprot:scaffold2365_cov77-Skeletonema_dohrnii-CCMP3373.AAC.42